MEKISFEKLYNTEFFISDVMAKPQRWAQRGNIYNAIGKPKVSHTLLWFKNCSATITDLYGNVLNAKQNQLAYMAKGLEYIVEFHNTDPILEDTIVIHFQMTDKDGCDLIPEQKPIICINEIKSSFSMSINLLVDEFKKNIPCIPLLNSEVYKILAAICQKQKKHTTKSKYAVIRKGIELLEQDSDLNISEISLECGVSECYFRRLFQEYSGESPMNFRQSHRIERAKQLLLSDENFTISEIAQELHFSDIYHFSKTFKKYCGQSPNNFLKSNKTV